MTDDKWEELLDRIESQFGVLDEGEEILPGVSEARREFVIFNGPMGKMMLERTTRSKVIGEKSFGGSKYGAGSGVEKIYSPDETVKIVKAYQDEDGGWVEIDAGSFGQ